MFYHNENAKLGTDNNTKSQWQKFDCCCCLPQESDSIFSHKFHILAINCESGARVHLKERKQQKSLKGRKRFIKQAEWDWLTLSSISSLTSDLSRVMPESTRDSRTSFFSFFIFKVLSSFCIKYRFVDVFYIPIILQVVNERESISW